MTMLNVHLAQFIVDVLNLIAVSVAVIRAPFINIVLITNCVAGDLSQLPPWTLLHPVGVLLDVPFLEGIWSMHCNSFVF